MLFLCFRKIQHDLRHSLSGDPDPVDFSVRLADCQLVEQVTASKLQVEVGRIEIERAKVIESIEPQAIILDLDTAMTERGIQLLSRRVGNQRYHRRVRQPRPKTHISHNSIAISRKPMNCFRRTIQPPCFGRYRSQFGLIASTR